MTVQLSQVQSPPSSLLQDTHTQNTPDSSFQNYLDEETRRLLAIFSPFGQASFNSWFDYAELNFQPKPGGGNVQLFADLETAPAETRGQPQASGEIRHDSGPLQQQAVVQAGQEMTGRPMQAVLQELLQQSGWLTPNLEALPLFARAQLDGKMLDKLDLQFLVDQILTQVKMIREKGKTELTLGLKPENLGEIILTLTARSGMISIQIQANEDSRKLLEDELQALELALKKAKVNLAEIKISGPEEVDQHA